MVVVVVVLQTFGSTQEVALQTFGSNQNSLEVVIVEVVKMP